MKQVTYSEARQNLSELINLAYNNCEPVYITRKNGSRVVILNAEDYESMDETRYLSKNPANLKHLQRAIQNMDTRKNIREVSDVEDLFK